MGFNQSIQLDNHTFQIAAVRIQMEILSMFSFSSPHNFFVIVQKAFRTLVLEKLFKIYAIP
jgi:hypothetical protein